MSIVEYCRNLSLSPQGFINYWEKKTNWECAREILRCWNRIEELETGKLPQDVEEFIAKHAYQDGHDRFSCRCVSVEALTDWMAGHVRVPVEPSIAMVDAGVALARQVSASGQGGWRRYIRALYKQMINEIKENQ